MRIWSLHPSQLDRAALVAGWRETLLAQAVLAGRTRGYRNHPQLDRFRAQTDPLAAVGAYLDGVATEADARGYRFDRSRILYPPGPEPVIRMPLTTGQLAYEWQHLGRKLQQRSHDEVPRWEQSQPLPHPVFHLVEGGIEPWERP